MPCLALDGDRQFGEGKEEEGKHVHPVSILHLTCPGKRPKLFCMVMERDFGGKRNFLAFLWALSWHSPSSLLAFFFGRGSSAGSMRQMRWNRQGQDRQALHLALPWPEAGEASFACSMVALCMHLCCIAAPGREEGGWGQGRHTSQAGGNWW